MSGPWATAKRFGTRTHGSIPAGNALLRRNARQRGLHPTEGPRARRPLCSTPSPLSVRWPRRACLCPTPGAQGSDCRERPEAQTDTVELSAGTGPTRRAHGRCGWLCALALSEVFCVERPLFIYLSCEQKTNSKMSKIKQVWYFTAAETTKMNDSGHSLLGGGRPAERRCETRLLRGTVSNCFTVTGRTSHSSERVQARRGKSSLLETSSFCEINPTPSSGSRSSDTCCETETCRTHGTFPYTQNRMKETRLCVT